MAAKRRTPIRDKDLQGLKYFKLLGPLLDRLHDDATARDHAGNRRLFYDQYACLLLLFFFNPIVKSLRGIQQGSELDKVQRLFGCGRVSRGSLSEASQVFDPDCSMSSSATLQRKRCRWFTAGKRMPYAASRPWMAVSCPPCPKWPGLCGSTRSTAPPRCTSTATFSKVFPSKPP